MKAHTLLVVLIVLGTSFNVRVSAEPGPATAPTTGYVTREEYEKLKSDFDALRREMAATKESAPTKEEVDQTIEEIEKDIKQNRQGIRDFSLGSTNFLLTGYAATGFVAQEHGDSSFGIQFNPIFLWKLNDRLLFEAELEVEFADGVTDIGLEYADMSYIVNDYVIVGGGKFLLPFGQFNPRLHPAWINKLPDRPLPYSDEVGIAPESSVGAYIRGAAPLSSSQVNYAFYVGNAPLLITDNPDAAGQLDFEDSANSDIAGGGRIGFLPIPELEVGYSFQFGQVNPSDFPGTDAFLQAFDFSYLREIDAIKGTLDLRCEWVWSNVGNATYDPTGTLGFGPLQFTNNRNSGYVQAAYRPTQSDSRIIRNLEFVGRYDTLNVPAEAPGSVDEQRWTIGLDYWVTPSCVLKTAYQFDDRQGGEPDENAFFLQAALGF